MSHVVTIRTEVRDKEAIIAACRRLSLPQPVEASHKLFSSTVTGLGVQLPGWRYPAVCNVATGSVQYDTFEGRWGDVRELHRLIQAYSIAKATIEARKRGHTVSEQPLADGSIKLTISVGA